MFLTRRKQHTLHLASRNINKRFFSSKKETRVSMKSSLSVKKTFLQGEDRDCAVLLDNQDVERIAVHSQLKVSGIEQENDIVIKRLNKTLTFAKSIEHDTVDNPAYHNKILEIHNDAVKNDEYSYIDPATGYMVFTELKAIKRGACCGMCCRHCPFQYEKVCKEKLIGKPPPITTASIPR
jgi:hypothetical protein